MRYGVVHISVGQLIREEVQAGTRLGKKMRASFDQGELVSDSLALHLVRITFACILMISLSTTGFETALAA